MKYLLMLLATALIAVNAHADIAIPTTTEVYFTLDGKPYDKPVQYTITCRGQMIWPGKEPSPEGEVYSYSANCPKYGCSIDEPYYLNYRRISYCNLLGEADGKPFAIENFGTFPGGKCDDKGAQRHCVARFEIPGKAVGAAAAAK